MCMLYCDFFCIRKTACAIRQAAPDPPFAALSAGLRVWIVSILNNLCGPVLHIPDVGDEIFVEGRVVGNKQDGSRIFGESTL